MINIPNTRCDRIAEPISSKGFYLKTVLEEFQIAHPHDEGKIIGPAKREFMKSRKAVAIMVHCSGEDRILMSRQFRMPVFNDTGSAEGAWIYEIIAGVVDDGEQSVETAIREAKEEAGIELKRSDIYYVGSFYTSPGISTEKIDIFTCDIEKVVPIDRNGGLAGEAEAIVSEWLSYEDVRTLMRRGQIMDAKTWIAISEIGW